MKKFILMITTLSLLAACDDGNTRKCTEKEAAIEGVVQIVGMTQGMYTIGGCD